MKIRELNEAIKGWKNAGRDISASRRRQREESNEYMIKRLNKNGKESKISTETKTFRTENEARKHVANFLKLNPGRGIKFNLYTPKGSPEVLS